MPTKPGKWETYLGQAEYAEFRAMVIMKRQVQPLLDQAATLREKAAKAKEAEDVDAMVR